MKKLILIFFLCSVEYSVFSQEKKYSTFDSSKNNKTFLCVMDKSTGFVFEKEKQIWNVRNSRVDEQKFLLELNQKDQGTFYRFGSKSDKKKISSNCTKSRKIGFIVCNGLLGGVYFSKFSNLITHSFIYGYTVDKKFAWNNMSLSPSLSIGKCSQLKLNPK